MSQGWGMLPRLSVLPGSVPPISATSWHHAK
jgi:hypothetical protein